MTKRTLLRLGVALGAGAVGAGVVIALTKTELQRDLQASGDALRRELQRSGSTLQRRIEASARDAAKAAVVAEIQSMGITPQLVQQTVASITRLNALVARFT